MSVDIKKQDFIFEALLEEVNTANRIYLHPHNVQYTIRDYFFQCFFEIRLKKILLKGMVCMDKFDPKSGPFVFTAYITLKNGKRVYAKQYGKKAFCIPVSKMKEE